METHLKPRQVLLQQLREEVQKGLDQLDAGLGRPLNAARIKRRARAVQRKQSAHDAPA